MALLSAMYFVDLPAEEMTVSERAFGEQFYTVLLVYGILSAVCVIKSEYIEDWFEYAKSRNRKNKN